MMTCREIVELMLEYLEGELPREYCDLICQHIRLCGPCNHFLESYQVTIRMGRQLPMAAVPQQLIDRLQAALKEMESEK
jgi:hypothetical protein